MYQCGTNSTRSAWSILSLSHPLTPIPGKSEQRRGVYASGMFRRGPRGCFSPHLFRHLHSLSHPYHCPHHHTSLRLVLTPCPERSGFCEGVRCRRCHRTPESRPLSAPPHSSSCRREPVAWPQRLCGHACIKSVRKFHGACHHNVSCVGVLLTVPSATGSQVPIVSQLNTDLLTPLLLRFLS